MRTRVASLGIAVGFGLLLGMIACAAATPTPPSAPGTTCFRLAELKQLRARAAEATRSQPDPARLLAAFPALRLRPGYTLRSDPPQDEDGATVWAEAPGSAGSPAARLHVMAGVGGDGTPWSYVSASLFRRQVNELGAIWHGIVWGSISLIDGVPADDPGAPFWRVWLAALRPDAGDRWSWQTDQPKDWRPRVQMGADGVVVTFYAHDRRSPEGLYEYVDVYQPGNYRAETGGTILARGARGYTP